MPNKLQFESSPYLLQHADNPVNWFPWSPEALQLAERENKPIFLSIGYAACHWCHVMAHESFENPQIAHVLNENFVNIKVDREERPDLDKIYMDAVVSSTGQGGWPLSVFLTPNCKPFFGGTYFPPTKRYNIPGFLEVLYAVSNAWENNPYDLISNAQKIIEFISMKTPLQTEIGEISIEFLNHITQILANNYDWKFGGWGHAPKFPQPMIIDFLLSQAERGNQLGLELSEHVLQTMAMGGMYDVVGGGFARYSTDNNWLVPHFEKMLYDNAQLASVYLHAYLLTKNEIYKEICEETLSFILREMTHPDGGFYSSIDADSEGEEGKYYVWDYDEIYHAVRSPDAAKVFIYAYGITRSGNFDGKNILQQIYSINELSQQFNISSQEIAKLIIEAKQDLQIYRDKRLRPLTDDKVLTSWNGLMLRTLSEAGRYINNPVYIDAAKKNADFLLSELWNGEILFRAWRNGKANIRGYLEDYASLILGLLTLYQTDYDLRWFTSAVKLTNEMISGFSDPTGGFFDTHSQHENLIIRPKSIEDNAIPSGNALAANALFYMYSFTGNEIYYKHAKSMWQIVSNQISRYPTAFGQWLITANYSLGPVSEIAVLYSQSDSADEMIKIINSEFRPRTILAVSEYPISTGSPPLFDQKTLLNNTATTFVCENFICKNPVTDPQNLQILLNDQGSNSNWTGQ